MGIARFLLFARENDVEDFFECSRRNGFIFNVTETFGSIREGVWAKDTFRSYEEVFVVVSRNFAHIRGVFSDYSVGVDKSAE